MTISMLPRSVLALALPLAFLACAGPDNQPSQRDVGSAVLALTQAPAEVRCVRISAVGTRTVVRSFETMGGQSTQFEMNGLPLGLVTFTGEAFDLACGQVMASSVPGWVSDPVPVTLTSGNKPTVMLTMRRNGRATVSVDFADETNCSMPGKFCFAAALTGASEVPPVMTDLAGTATFILDTTSGLLNLHLVHNVLDATAAHVHGPAMPGMNAPVLVPISPPGPDVSVSATLTATQVSHLYAGLLYINVHNAAHPGGVIRGQILPAP
jgi:hypothetical protein